MVVSRNSLAAKRASAWGLVGCACAIVTVVPAIILFPLASYWTFGHFTHLPPRYPPETLKWELVGLVAYCILAVVVALVAGLRRLLGFPQGWFVRWVAPLVVLPLYPFGTLIGFAALAFGGPDGTTPASRSRRRWRGELVWAAASFVIAGAWAIIAEAALSVEENLLDRVPYTVAVILACDAAGAIGLWYGMRRAAQRGAIDALAAGMDAAADGT